nr:hypothetical protein [Tanacetum cinerariifolium]
LVAWRYAHQPRGPHANDNLGGVMAARAVSAGKKTSKKEEEISKKFSFFKMKK